MRVLAWFLGGLAALIGVFLLWPSPIDSRAFEAGPIPPLEGALAPNRVLERCQPISVGEILHSDKLLVGPEGIRSDLHTKAHR